MLWFILELRQECLKEGKKDENKGKKIFRFEYQRIWVTRVNHLDIGEISDIQVTPKSNE